MKKSLTASFAVLMLTSASLVYSIENLEFDETVITSPLTDSNEEPLYNTVCKTRDHLRWDVCFNRDENNIETMKSFKFTNYGENKIVPMSGFGVGRDFEFMFEGFARSDLGLLIWDAPDTVESHAHLKLLNFFPRDVLPAIRYASDSESDVVIVTLPTKEEVVFNGKTREILSGALTEGPIRQNSDGSAVSPDVSYVGSGVVIETHALADWPVGVIQQSAKNALIKKQGQKTCSVPVKDLWYTDHDKGGNVFFNKKYVTDVAFDSFLKARCKFSMY